MIINYLTLRPWLIMTDGTMLWTQDIHENKEWVETYTREEYTWSGMSLMSYTDEAVKNKLINFLTLIFPWAVYTAM